MNQSPILVIEDDENIRTVCRELLQSEGFEVDTCEDGKKALAFLERHQEPSLILLDMMMPVMNGREFMTGFAKRPHTIVPIPVYLVSATSNDEEGKKMGCMGFLKKPFNVDALLAIVHSHCEANHCKRNEISKLAIPPIKREIQIQTGGV